MGWGYCRKVVSSFTRLVHTHDNTFFICVTWSIHTCDMTLQDIIREALSEFAVAVIGVTRLTRMGWLRLVGSLKWWVSFAKESYKRDDILQQSPIIGTFSTALNVVHRNLLQNFQIFHDVLLNFANFRGGPLSKSMQILEKRIETVGNHVQTVRTC